MEDDPPTAEDLYEDLGDLETQLRETRRSANDREAQYQAISDVSRVAELTLPTGFGDKLDRALVGAKAAAILLLRALHRAQKNVPTLPQDVDSLVGSIDRLLHLLPPVQSELKWLIHTA